MGWVGNQRVKGVENIPQQSGPGKFSLLKSLNLQQRRELGLCMGTEATAPEPKPPSTERRGMGWVDNQE